MQPTIQLDIVVIGYVNNGHSIILLDVNYHRILYVRICVSASSWMKANILSMDGRTADQ